MLGLLQLMKIKLYVRLTVCSIASPTSSSMVPEFALAPFSISGIATGVGDLDACGRGLSSLSSLP
jgi:hypothetical protein